jgi:hypothetical protein
MHKVTELRKSSSEMNHYNMMASIQTRRISVIQKKLIGRVILEVSIRPQMHDIRPQSITCRKWKMNAIKQSRKVKIDCSFIRVSGRPLFNFETIFYHKQFLDNICPSIKNSIQTAPVRTIKRFNLCKNLIKRKYISNNLERENICIQD